MQPVEKNRNKENKFIKKKENPHNMKQYKHFYVRIYGSMLQLLGEQGNSIFGEIYL